jgi:DNA-directed RNA polymerase subunit L
MGWSVEIIRPQLDAIFKENGIKYDIQHPDAMSPMVYITYEGKLADKVIRYIVDLFPEFVYVDIKPTTFPAKGE